MLTLSGAMKVLVRSGKASIDIYFLSMNKKLISCHQLIPQYV